MNKFNHVDSIIKIACCLNHMLEAYRYVDDFDDYKTIIDIEMERLEYCEIVRNEDDSIKYNINAMNTIIRDYGKSEFSPNLLDAWNGIKEIIYPLPPVFEETKRGYLADAFQAFSYRESFNRIK